MPPSHFHKNHFNVIFLSTPVSSKWPFSVSFTLPHQNPVCNTPLSHTCYLPRPYHCRECGVPILKPTTNPEIIFTNLHPVVGYDLHLVSVFSRRCVRCIHNWQQLQIVSHYILWTFFLILFQHLLLVSKCGTL